MTLAHTETSLKKENEYPKLVRDKIPKIVEEITGKKVLSRTMNNDEEYLAYLMKKVEEEANELAHAESKDHVIEEIADVLELIDALAAFYQVDKNTLKQVQKAKAKKRGGFMKRILMLKKVD